MQCVLFWFDVHIRLVIFERAHTTTTIVRMCRVTELWSAKRACTRVCVCLHSNRNQSEALKRNSNANKTRAKLNKHSTTDNSFIITSTFCFCSLRHRCVYVQLFHQRNNLTAAYLVAIRFGSVKACSNTLNIECIAKCSNIDSQITVWWKNSATFAIQIAHRYSLASALNFQFHGNHFKSYANKPNKIEDSFESVGLRHGRKYCCVSHWISQR